MHTCVHICAQYMFLTRTMTKKSVSNLVKKNLNTRTAIIYLKSDQIMIKKCRKSTSFFFLIANASGVGRGLIFSEVLLAWNYACHKNPSTARRPLRINYESRNFLRKYSLLLWPALHQLDPSLLTSYFSYLDYKVKLPNLSLGASLSLSPYRCVGFVVVLIIHDSTVTIRFRNGPMQQQFVDRSIHDDRFFWLTLVKPIHRASLCAHPANLKYFWCNI